jgi:hypothetical protein
MSARHRRLFFYSTDVQRALLSTEPPIKWVWGAFSLGIKRSQYEADLSPPSNVEVKHGGSIHSLPQYVLMA